MLMPAGKVYTLRSKGWCIAFLMAFLTIFCPSFIIAQDENELYEIDVFLKLQKVGGIDIPSVIRDDQVYLSIGSVFDYLKIRNQTDSQMESVSGYFINPGSEYSISRKEMKIVFEGKQFNIASGDIIKTESALYLHSGYFGSVFGMFMEFDFRNLMIQLNTSLDLPLIRELRIEEMRRNLNRLKGEIIADTNIARSYPLFKFGMADWSLYANQERDGRSDYMLNVDLGSMIAGGEATASLNINSLQSFTEKNQFYRWRYVDNDYKIFKQFTAGKISAQTTSSLFSPVLGVQLTNTPTTYRRSFGTYTLTDKTEPEWVVELYINNVLVDYVKADASGFFTFEVPLVYGNSDIQLKYYGPWGEEKVKDQNIVIPYNFLPPKTFEYQLSAGVVEDTLFSRFSRLSTNYGISRYFTIGGGIEYLSSLSTPFMPYVSASLNVFDNLLFSGEFTYGVRSKASFSYRTKSNVLVDLDITKYDPDQEAIHYNYLEERKASLSVPFRVKGFSAYNRFSAYQIILPVNGFHDGELVPMTTNYTTGEWMLSASFLGMSTSLSTNAVFIGDTDPRFYSNLSASMRIPAKILFRPQLQYSYSTGELLTLRFGFEKNIKQKAFLNLSFEQNLTNDLKMAELGFRYNFSFAQTGVSVRQQGKRSTFTEYARGSLLYDGSTKYLGTDFNSNVGRGGIIIIPFIDLNNNGTYDKREPRAAGLNLKINGGKLERNERDSTIRIIGLEPYTSYFIELDENSFENISWRLPIRTLSVDADPNILKHIEIPVKVVGEVSGAVMNEQDNPASGIGRIILRFYDDKNNAIGSTLTENDGYFSLFGLLPGNYTATIDSSQLLTLGLVASPKSIDFTISPGFDGDIADGIDFIVTKLISDTIPVEMKQQEVKITRDTTVMIVHELVEELVTISKDSWAIQLGAFKNRTNAENLRKKLQFILGRKLDIVIADGYFKVRINEIPDRPTVDDIIEVLRRNDITEVWIISLRAKQQQLVLRERQDSVVRVVETRTEEPGYYESKIFIPMGDSFYNLDLPGKGIIDRTLIDIMKNSSDLREIKVRDISPEITIVRSDTVEIYLPDEFMREVTEIDFIREEVNITQVVTRAFPRIAPVNNTIFARVISAVRAPQISLQVGTYYKKSEALKAQKKIMSKLNVPVKIVQQWEYYRVIVTGFHSREEAFPYYPELAGIGFPGPVLIEE